MKHLYFLFFSIILIPTLSRAEVFNACQFYKASEPHEIKVMENQCKEGTTEMNSKNCRGKRTMFVCEPEQATIYPPVYSQITRSEDRKQSEIKWTEIACDDPNNIKTCKGDIKTWLCKVGSKKPCKLENTEKLDSITEDLFNEYVKEEGFETVCRDIFEKEQPSKGEKVVSEILSTVNAFAPLVAKLSSSAGLLPSNAINNALDPGIQTIGKAAGNLDRSLYKKGIHYTDGSYPACKKNNKSTSQENVPAEANTTGDAS